MKKLLPFIFAWIMIFTTFSTASAASNFKDIPLDYWAKGEIDYLISQKIIYGYSDGSFKPNVKLSRIQIAMMIQRAKKYSESGRPNPNLVDIKPGTKYYSLVATLMDEGLFTDLVKNRKFEPDKSVSRSEMASVLSKAFKLSGVSDKKFSDVPANHWAYQYVQALAANDITYGVTESTFVPNQEINRVQFTAFLARTLNDSFRPKPSNSRTNPAALGEIIEVKGNDWLDGYRHYQIGLMDVISDGDVAWEMISNANMFNDPPPPGQKYILAKFYFKLVEADNEPFEAYSAYLDAVSKTGVVYENAMVVEPDPDLWRDLYIGGEYQGWAAFLVDEGDEPLIVWNRDGDDELWFSLK